MLAEGEFLHVGNDLTVQSAVEDRGTEPVLFSSPVRI